MNAAFSISLLVWSFDPSSITTTSNSPGYDVSVTARNVAAMTFSSL